MRELHAEETFYFLLKKKKKRRFISSKTKTIPKKKNQLIDRTIL